MTFHITPQFHATISHHTLFFTTPFCTTSHSVVHPGLRHSTPYNIPFHITPYNKYISSVVPFNSALNAHFSPLDFDYFVCVREVVCHWFRACVCSGHIPHHKCRSVYVINRVQITFHITLLHTTLNFFTPRIIPSHNTKRFYIPLSHTTPFHITLPLHNIPHHFSAYHMFHFLRRLMSQHISPRTTIFNIWHHITPQSASHRHVHTTTSHRHSPHLTPFHIHNYSTPHPQHRSTFHTTTIFHITLHHHIMILHHNDIWQHTASFSTSDTTQQPASTHCIWPHSSSQFHTTMAAIHIVTFHIWHYATFHLPGHHILCHTIFHITHFAFRSHSTSYNIWNSNISHTHHTTFHVAP